MGVNFLKQIQFQILYFLLMNIPNRPEQYPITLPIKTSKGK